MNVDLNYFIISVCGPHAICTAAVHRPVCACEDGYEGNPYDKCTKVSLKLFINEVYNWIKNISDAFTGRNEI